MTGCEDCHAQLIVIDGRVAVDRFSGSVGAVAADFAAVGVVVGDYSFGSCWGLFFGFLLGSVVHIGRCFVPDFCNPSGRVRG